MSQSETRRYAANPADLPPGTLMDLFFHAIEKFDLPDAQQYRTHTGWRAISHRDLLDNVHVLGDALVNLGLERGDRVALLSENRPEWAWADWAMLSIGVLNVPIYPTLPANQISYILNNASVRAVFVSNVEQLAKIRECQKTVPSLTRVITFDNLDGYREGEESLKQLLARTRAGSERTEPDEFRRRARSAKPDDAATIIYTSGTTGHPKGVMLTHNNLYSNCVAQSWMKPPEGDPFVTVSFLPLSHVFQRMVDYCLYWLGCSIAYSTIDGFRDALQEVRPTLAVAVPRVYEKVYTAILTAHGFKRRVVLWARQVALDWADHRLDGKRVSLKLRIDHAVADRLVFRKLRAAVGGRLRFFVSGGAPLSPQIARFFYGAGVLILEGYGLTETSPVLAVNIPGSVRMGTVGKPVPGTELAIADDGEILARGPQIMKGYYNDPDATAEVIDSEGWFHTGDIGTIDTDGYLRITDRKKDLIVTAGGKNVAPQPIQNAAKASRFVADAVVIGDKRPYPILLVVPNFEVLTKWAQHHEIRWARKEDLVVNPQVRQRLEEEVFRHLNGFARYEMPKKLVILPREFDLSAGEITPKLSVRRHIVEKNFRDAIEAVYAENTQPAEAG